MLVLLCISLTFLVWRRHEEPTVETHSLEKVDIMFKWPHVIFPGEVIVIYKYEKLS